MQNPRIYIWVGGNKIWSPLPRRLIKRRPPNSLYKNKWSLTGGKKVPLKYLPHDGNGTFLVVRKNNILYSFQRSYLNKDDYNNILSISDWCKMVFRCWSTIIEWVCEMQQKNNHMKQACHLFIATIKDPAHQTPNT